MMTDTFIATEYFFLALEIVFAIIAGVFLIRYHNYDNFKDKQPVHFERQKSSVMWNFLFTCLTALSGVPLIVFGLIQGNTIIFITAQIFLFGLLFLKFKYHTKEEDFPVLQALKDIFDLPNAAFRPLKKEKLQKYYYNWIQDKWY